MAKTVATSFPGFSVFLRGKTENLGNELKKVDRKSLKSPSIDVPFETHWKKRHADLVVLYLCPGFLKINEGTKEAKVGDLSVLEIIDLIIALYHFLNENRANKNARAM